MQVSKLVHVFNGKSELLKLYGRKQILWVHIFLNNSSLMAKPETYSTLSLMYLKSRLRYHLSYELCMNAPSVCFMYVE